MRDFAELDWTLKTSSDGSLSWPAVHTAVLMDIRAELRKTNTELQKMNYFINLRCGRFGTIPRHLRQIALNTSKVAKTRKRAKRR